MEQAKVAALWSISTFCDRVLGINNQSMKTKLVLHITHHAVHGSNVWFISSLPPLKLTFIAESSFRWRLKPWAVINEGHGFREASLLMLWQWNQMAALIRCFWEEEQPSSTSTRDSRPPTPSCPRTSVIIKWVALTLPVLEEVISPSRYQHFRLMSLLNCSLVKRAMCSLVSLRDLASLCQCWSPPYSCRLVNR